MEIAIDNTSRLSLSNDIIFGSYLNTIKKINTSTFRNKDANEKLNIYQRLADGVLKQIKFPFRVNLKYDSELNKKGNKKLSTIIAEANHDTGNEISLGSTRFNTNSPIDFIRVNVTLYHELRHIEQIFRGLQYYAQKDSTTKIYANTDKLKQVPLTKDVVIIKDMQIGVGIWQQAKITPIPENILEFARIMSDAIVTRGKSEYAKINTSLELTMIIERDAYNFSREGHRILRRIASPSLSPEKIDLSWYKTGFGFIEKGSNVAPAGYIDRYAGLFSSRINLSDLKRYPEIQIN